MKSHDLNTEYMPHPDISQKQERSIRQLLCRLWFHLGQRRRLQLVLLLLLMLFSSTAEVVSLAAVLPFLAVLANPEVLWKEGVVEQWSVALGINRPEELLLPITVIFVLAAVFAGSVRLLNLWLNARLAAAIGSDLSCKAYRHTLYQSYEVHIKTNSSHLISTISNDVVRVIYLVLNPLLLLLSSGLIAASLLLTLLFIDWVLALFTGLLILLMYAAAMVVTRTPLQRLGRRQVFLNQKLIQSLQEGLGAIREVMLDGRTSFYEENYRDADRPLRRASADSTFLNSFPRLVLEPAGMALIAASGYVLVQQQGVNRALPLLGALALGAQRLLPMAQKVYEGWAQSRVGKESMLKLLDLSDKPFTENSHLSI